MLRRVGLWVLTLFAPTTFAASTAFVNVNVISMSDESIALNQTVIVEEGLIARIGPVDSTSLPKDSVVVDGTDRYLLPGLHEMHAHVPDPASPERDRVLTLFAANGVTTLRGMAGGPWQLRLRAALQEGELFGPRLITSGPSLNGSSVRSAADGVRQVKAQFEAGYDFLKIHPGLDAKEFAAIAEAANELGMPFAGHVPTAVGVREALAAGIATIDHLDGYLAALMPPDADASGGYGGFLDVLLADQVMAERIPRLAAATAVAGTWNVPTQTLFEHRVSAETVTELSNRPEMRFMPPATVRQWAAVKKNQLDERGFDPALAEKAIALRRRLILALHEAGAGLLLGSDAPQVFNVPGFSLHDELELLVAAGLTPFEALTTGTRAPAAFLGTNAGLVAAGRDADLILLDANPLDDIRNTRRIHGVMLRGQWYAARELQQRLQPFRSKGD